MARFKAKCKDDCLHVRVKLSHGDAINDAELESFARTYIRGFLKPNKIKKNVIEYTGPAGVSLYERMKCPVLKYDFLFIMEQIVDTFQKLQQFRLLPGRVVWDIQNIYFNEFTKELQFIYIPFTSSKSGYNILSLIEAVGYAAIPQGEQDLNYVSRFMYFLSSLPVFNAESIENFIAKEDRKVVNVIKKHAAGQSGFMTDKRKDYCSHYENRMENGGSEPTGLLDEDGQTGLLEEEETGLLNEEETGLLNENAGAAPADIMRENVHYPSLFRVLTEERALINKPVFRIGKERSYVDFFVTNNSAVSRSHADIITRGRRYFIMDLNSKNKTFINDQAIPVQQEVELSDGDHLRLANEEFIFYI